jgi:eukaryotic-like serine/threonine-protein kinase
MNRAAESNPAEPVNVTQTLLSAQGLTGMLPGPQEASQSAANDPLLEMLVLWEEEWAQGRSLPAEELCPHNLALQTEVRERIARRKRMLAALDLAGVSGSAGPAATRTLPLPTLDGYEIAAVIGQGGMGVVYKARQLALNRVVAIKMILSGLHASSHELARFRAEAEAVARLAHANIVQIFEIGEQQGNPYLALEYIAGGSLAQQLDGNPLTPKRAAELVRELAKGVQHAHDKGIVHRDLKPANVLIHTDGTLKITDFGLAKRAEGNFAHTMTGAIIGSPSYMAPEQASGNSAEIGPATDIYALGVILYELLTGRPPFKGDSVISTIEQVREQEPLSPRLLQPKVPRDLETICLKCLEKKPSRRYLSAAALAADLDSYLHDEPINAQSLTFLDQVTRTIAHHGFDERIRGLANVMLCVTPIPLTLHLAAFAYFYKSPHYASGMIATTSVMLFTLVPLLMSLGMPSLRLIPTWQRKHFFTTWIGHTVAMAVLLAAVLIAIPADQPEQRLMIYSIWAAAAALSFLSHAVEAGFYYVVAGIMFCMSIVLAFTPTWAPLEVACLMTLNMGLQGLLLRRVSNEPGYELATREKIAAATTIVPPL